MAPLRNVMVPPLRMVNAELVAHDPHCPRRRNSNLKNKCGSLFADVVRLKYDLHNLMMLK